MTTTKNKIPHNLILIDDNPDFINEMEITLGNKYNLIPFYDPTKVFPLLKHENNNIILLDIDLGTHKTGIDYIPSFLKQDPYAQIIMLSSEKRPKIVASSIKKGAIDYLSKLSSIDEIEGSIEKCLQNFKIHKFQLQQKNKRVIYQSKIMSNIFDELKLISQTDTSILLTGESGVGKDLLAKEIHHLSPRKNKPFYKIHCPSLTDELFESELFGHVKGSFTGAMSEKIGKIETANGGTLLLDEITETSLSIQAKLLRLVEDKEFERVGSVKTLHSDIRIISNTNKNLEEYIESNRFRHDLFYRLSTFIIEIPPLRDRTEDIMPLARHFHNYFIKKYNLPPKKFNHLAIYTLLSYNWPGNIRELKHIMERLIIKNNQAKTITQQMIEDAINKEISKEEVCYHEAFNTTMNNFKYNYLASLLRKTHGVVSKAAHFANIPRQSLTRMLKECGISPSSFKSET